MVQSRSLPDEILFMIVQACIPPFQSIKIGPNSTKSTKSASKIVQPSIYGLPNSLNLQLVSRSFRAIAYSCTQNSFGGGLKLTGVPKSFHHLPIFQPNLNWIIPRITHLAFPVHFADLGTVNELISHAIPFPSLRILHIDWKMRLDIWEFPEDNVSTAECVEVVVADERRCGHRIARYFDTFQKLSPYGTQLLVDYTLDIATGDPEVYSYTLDVSTERCVMLESKFVQGPEYVMRWPV